MSHLNYPGGTALVQLNKHIISEGIPAVKVHIETPACMTGVSRFGELQSSRYLSVDYSRDEDLPSTMFDDFDWLLTSQSWRVGFERVDSVSGLEKILVQKTFPFVAVKLTEKLHILKRNKSL